jgi:hypothetical protein
MADKKEKLEKIRKLMQQGFGGEKQNADALFNKLLKKYGLTEADFLDYQIQAFSINFANKYERKLIAHMIGRVVSYDTDIWTVRKEKKLHFLATKEQYFDILAYKSVIVNSYKRERRAFDEAFRIKNNLVRYADDENQFSAEEIEKARKEAMAMKKYYNNIQAVEVTRQIEKQKK